MKQLFFTLIIAFAITNYSYSQVTQEWVSRFPAYDLFQSDFMAVDNAGNVYVTGLTNSNNTLADFLTVKYNSSGQEQWSKRYNGQGNTNDGPSAIGIDQAGNVYVTGITYVGTFVYYVTIKYSSTGNVEWTLILDGINGGDYLTNNMVVDSAGNIFQIIETSSGLCTTLKLNSSGQQEWIAYYSANPGSIAIDASGNAYVAGAVFSSTRFVAIKYNSNGQRQWDTTYSSPGSSQCIPSKIVVDNSGNVYLTGYSLFSGVTDIATVKYNSSGNQQWAETYGGPGNGNDFASSIGVDISGNVYVAGNSSVSSSETDYTVLKYNSTGQRQWVSTYGSGYAKALKIDASGNIYVTGYSVINDYTTLKYNSSGQMQWVATYSGTGSTDDFATAILLDAASSVYVTGSSGIGNSFEYATIKYSQITGITQISNSNPDKFSLSQNYPNPFNPTTKINYELPVPNYVSLKVYDMLGSEVAALVNKKQNAGSYSVEWDASNFSSGIYFYKIETNEFVQTKKMTLLK